MTKIERIRKQILSITFWGILVVSFVFFATLIILKANGYQLNWSNWKIIETGMIVIDGQPQDVDIKMNQKYFKNLPEQFSNLTPGDYNITISKNGYTTWQKKLHVDSGKAITDENILLYLSNPTDITTPNNITAERILTEYQNRSQDIKINESEIYWQDKLISRFGSKILAASFYPDSRHIIFQESNEIRIIDLDGSNNVLLVTLKSHELTAFTFQDNGKTLIYLDGGQIFAKTIR